MIRSLPLTGLLAGSLVAALSTTSSLHKNKAGKFKTTFALISFLSPCFRQSQPLVVAQDEIVRRFISGFFPQNLVVFSNEVTHRPRHSHILTPMHRETTKYHVFCDFLAMQRMLVLPGNVAYLSLGPLLLCLTESMLSDLLLAVVWANVRTPMGRKDGVERAQICTKIGEWRYIAALFCAELWEW
ncbi:hypothetical protein PRIPAC_90152 [Pristionchus pacificus]|uniref:Uncharacterized protein n=1 Tax=Pristionchus pacificus TaxID=54126 RepID=A0A2A6B888_PRIPA|nr:hypothetical protein PRIPAC_90152 [Pristionchus pacificus]|eukprot:PDM62084.1 hypothetical protein PRIPAC_51526 [Pristionchus pacificus]